MSRIAIGLGVVSAFICLVGMGLEFAPVADPPGGLLDGVTSGAGIAILMLLGSIPYGRRPGHAVFCMAAAFVIVVDAAVQAILGTQQSLPSHGLTAIGVPVGAEIAVCSTVVLGLLMLMRLSAPTGASLRGVVVIAASMLVIVLLSFHVLGIKAFGSSGSHMTTAALATAWASLALLLAGPSLARWFRPRDLASGLGQMGLIVSVSVPVGFGMIVRESLEAGSALGVLETFLILSLTIILTNMTLFGMFTYREAAAQTTRLRIARHMAHHDLLTGAKSRLAASHFVRSGHAMPGCVGQAVLSIVDIDNFKAFNDQRGHPVGDEVLNKVASAIAKAFGPDSFVARWGGDEFLVLTRDRDDATLAGFLEAINTKLGRLELDAGAGLSVSVSAGSARLGWPTSFDAFGTAVKIADDAMYRAKQAGGRQIVISDQVVAAAPAKEAEKLPVDRDWFENTLARQFLGAWLMESESANMLGGPKPKRRKQKQAARR